MNYFFYIKNLLALSLVGYSLFGIIFSFWYASEDLNMLKYIGAILFVLIGITCVRNTISKRC